MSWIVHLDAHNPLPSHEAHRLHFLPHDDLRRQSNEVHAEGLGHEREGAGDADVALDHLQLVVLDEVTNTQNQLMRKMKTK